MRTGRAGILRFQGRGLLVSLTRHKISDRGIIFAVLFRRSFGVGPRSDTVPTGRHS